MKSKKLFALLVAIAMCLPMVLASCDKLDKKDIEADPVGRINQSVCDTADSIVKSLSPLDPIRAAEKKGSFELSVAPAELDESFSLKGEYDTEAKKFVGDISVEAEDTSVNAKLNVENDKIAISAPDLFKGAYGFEFSTLMEDMKNSPLLELVGVNGEELVSQLEPMLTESPVDIGALSDAWKKLGDDLKARLNKCVSGIEKKDVTIGGTEVKAFEINFKLAKTDVVDIATILKDDLKPILEECEIMTPSSFYDNPGSQSPADMSDSAFDTLIEDINKEGNDVNAEITAYLSPKTCDFMGLRYVLTVTDGEEKTTGRIEGGIELGSEPAKPGKLNGTFKVTHKTADEDEKVDCDAKFALECVDDDKTFSVKLTTDAETMYYGESLDEGTDSVEAKNKNSLVIDFNNDKSAKTYVLKAEAKGIYDASDRGVNHGVKDFFELSGKLEYDATNLSVTADKLVYGHSVSVGDDLEAWSDPEQVETDGIGITFKLSANVGEITMPEYKNIWKLTQGELFDFVSQFSLETQGKLTEVIESFGDIISGIDNPGIGDGEKSYFEICDTFDDSFDYNLDGKIDDADRAEWEAEFKPYGSVFDETYDYDGDGNVGTEDDREAYDMMVSVFRTMPADNDALVPDDGISGGVGEREKSYFDICDSFDDSFDYNLDGKVDDADRDEWEAEFKPFGSVFDETYDYDGDGKVGTEEDRQGYAMMLEMSKSMPINYFNPYTAEFSTDYDYDGDGNVGTDEDRAEYEKYYKIFAEEFDPTVDYDQDGKVDSDDRAYYDMLRDF